MGNCGRLRGAIGAVGTELVMKERPMRGFIGMVAGIVVASLSASGQVTVTVDQNTRYQTIEGMGAGIHGFGPWQVKQGLHYVNVDLDAVAFYDTVVSGLGITLIRMLEDGSYEHDSAAFAITSYMGTQLGYAKRFLQAAQRQNEPLVVITSILSPPAYMKLSDTIPGLVEAAPDYNTTTCRLRDGYDGVYSRFLVRYLQAVRDSMGREEYALSLQNEPAFQEPYASCVYNGARYTSVAAAVGQAIVTAGLLTKFFGAEHMSWAFPNTFENVVRANTTALGYFRAWAVHGYTDGVHADTGSFAGSTPTDKPLWMSETSGSEFGTTTTDWHGAMTLANQMLGFFGRGRISAWNFLHVMQNGATVGAYYCDGQPTALYYVARHFSRFIRPGARQVASTITGAGVKAVAFERDADTCLTVVLINTTSAPVTVTLGGANLPASFTMISSNASTKNATSTVSGNASISLPDSSVTTLVSGRYRGTGSTGTRMPMVDRRGTMSHVSTGVDIYDLAGRRVIGVVGGRLTAGAYCRVPVSAKHTIVGPAKVIALGGR
jgi:O-glycosyl hydrolase